MAEEQELSLEYLKKYNATLASTIKQELKGARSKAEQQAILAEHSKEIKKNLKNVRGSTEAENAKRRQLYKAQDTVAKFGKQTIKTTSTLGAFGQKLKEVGLETEASFLGLFKGIKDTILQFTRADQRVEGFGDALKGMDTISILGVKLSDLGGVVDFNTGIYKQLAQTGATFGKSVIALREAAHDAQIPILDFVDLIQKQAPTLARLFGTVESSIPQITAFARELRTRTMEELAGFGLNLEETSEFLGTVLELERARGHADRIRTMDLVSTTVEYTKNLVKLSKLTGASVQELDKQASALAVNGAFQVQLNKLAPEEANRMTTMISGLKLIDPALAQFAEEMVALGQPISETSRFLTVMSGGALNDTIKAFQNGQIDAEQLFNQLRASANEAMKSGEAFGDLAYVGGGSADALRAFAELTGGQSEALKKEMTARDGATTDMVSARDSLQKLKSAAEQAATALFGDILNSGMVSKIMSGVEKAAEYLGGDNIFGDMYDKSKKALRVTVIDMITKGVAKGKEFAMAGEDKKNFWDNITPWDTKKEKQLKAGSDTGASFYTGTAGTGDLFRNFGTGTNATLHGNEAVVPKDSLFGNILDLFNTRMAAAGTTVDTGTDNAVATPVRADGDNLQLVTLNTTSKQIANSSQKLEQYLNTLISIGAMTEKNTKSTHKGLAELRGSLV